MCPPSPSLRGSAPDPKPNLLLFITLSTFMQQPDSRLYFLSKSFSIIMKEKHQIHVVIPVCAACVSISALLWKPLFLSKFFSIIMDGYKDQNPLEKEKKMEF